ncbi:nuclear transport factor 2 family protein [Novosphingobium beihaiensis]|uniref:Nuclear transport factor 2 family protein n=1 Tax=Novosphingobium beihaiensis TaxID=2930389 RepID=A0ABT0BTU3_9SPHN|nr:nuclear transport factor 2 family protein [Novosphingobium beihaiensis]MCJ2188447.1 nuclear transport factor 2 family protein [Novosphingobium beihaiensis]
MDVIARMYDAVERGDMPALGACFIPDARIWHNVDEVEKTVDTAAIALTHLCQSSTRLSYEDRRAVEAGNIRFVQHVITASLKSGDELRLPGMMRIELADDGRIARIEEYYDSRDTDPLMPR